MVINANNYKFDCRVSGNIKDELVILLHGFPETSYMYKDLIKDISDSGYYCIAPNLRGYSEGARPQGKNNYTLDKLVNDVLEMINHTGKDKLHIIGHDWGAVIGWQIAHDHPNKLLSWTALSVPHTNSFFNAILNDKEQKKKSWPKNYRIGCSFLGRRLPGRREPYRQHFNSLVGGGFSRYFASTSHDSTATWQAHSPMGKCFWR